jgi:polyhydroxybutyrate depolymerase
VLALHGGGSTAETMQNYLGLEAVAEREGFAVVYPQGANGFWEDDVPDAARPRPVGSGVDDVSFLRQLIQSLTDRGLVNPRRVYMTGLSNGGGMTVKMACKAPELFAAVAPLITQLTTKETCPPNRPMPILLLNGTADPIVAFDTVKSHGEFWAARNGCVRVADRDIADVVTTDKSTVKRRVHFNCSSGAGVEVYTITGGGHQTPLLGAEPAPIDRVLGPRNADMDSAETMWAFFKRHWLK